MTNYSIREQNVFHAFHGVSDDEDAIEEAMAVYLRHAEDRGKLVAERLALEWLEFKAVITYLLRMAAAVFGKSEIPDGLSEFMRDRWYHWRFPANGSGKTPFARGTA